MSIRERLQVEFGEIKADSFSELCEIAIGYLEEYECTELVCGPITTGGLGDMDSNLLRFASVIFDFKSKGKKIWNQMPFESELWRLRKDWIVNNPNEDDYNPILDEFYLPIFELGKFSSAHFIPGWETSKGAVWEHSNLKDLGVKCFYLSQQSTIRAEIRARDFMRRVSDGR